MSISAALSFGTTVLSYFSPTKSPFYAVIVFSALGVIGAAKIDGNWAIVYAPIATVLIIATFLALKTRPDLEFDEYDSQIKFARALGLSVSVLCMVYVGLTVQPDSGNNAWYFWLAYLIALYQMMIFALHMCLYANLKVRPVRMNLVQLALISSALLVAGSWSVVQFYNSASGSTLIFGPSEGAGGTSNDTATLASGGISIDHEMASFLLFYVLWTLTMIVWTWHLTKSVRFTLLIPEAIS